MGKEPSRKKRQESLEEEIRQSVDFIVSEKPSLGKIRSFRYKGKEPVWKNFFHRPRVLLGQYRATAICGNDITSSCLYVAALCTAQAGYLAPLALLLVAFVLYLFRNIYAEVGEALPLNGGAYNCLLNTTTKAKASVAACMTILSYVATAVISAKTSIEYLNYTFSGSLPVLSLTALLLTVFAFLVIMGIGESAKVALIIFITHIVTLSLLVITGLFTLVLHPEIFQNNWGVLPEGRTFWGALFFGFSAALLGVSGFESSSNFIEEQKPGVFPKTLRNMWLAITIFNPLICIVALGIFPIDRLVGAKKHLLAAVAGDLGGQWAASFLAIDAALVLAGAVLASFIGITGLVMRMTLDRCMPEFLNVTNKRGTNHRIILSFLVLCLSIIVITEGDLAILAGVYTIAFLSVMALFALGNMLLKIRRAKLPRTIRAGWLSLFIALIATSSGILGNIIMDGQNFKYFMIYFIPTVSFVLLTLYRHHLLQLFLTIVEDMMITFTSFGEQVKQEVRAKIKAYRSGGIIFFTKGDDVASLNRAMLYVQENESTKSITIVHILNKEQEPPQRLVRDLKLLDQIYPDLQIEFILRNGSFGPELIESLSSEFSIPPNYMFIGTPGIGFPFRLSELGGVRVII